MRVETRIAFSHGVTQNGQLRGTPGGRPRRASSRLRHNQEPLAGEGGAAARGAGDETDRVGPGGGGGERGPGGEAVCFMCILSLCEQRLISANFRDNCGDNSQKVDRPALSFDLFSMAS